MKALGTGLLMAAASLASALELPPNAAALVSAMRGHRVILLGEVHDNALQHALRLEALRIWIADGARPAIAFEQFDRDKQAQIDAARRARPGDAAYVIEQAAGGANWRWEYYQPFVQLALDHDLPIVAANLSRADAMRLSLRGWAAVLSISEIEELGVERLPAAFVEAHVRSVAEGHCNLLPEAQLPSLARAQIGRDLLLARAVRTHVDRGVVLLTGNGHARKDIGVPYWLLTINRVAAFSVALLEQSDAPDPPADLAGWFDAIVVTPRAERPDPCVELGKRLSDERTPRRP